MTSFASNSISAYTISSIANGNYRWNCKAVNSLGEESFASSDSTFIIPAANTAPSFTGTIPDHTPFNEDTTSSATINLATYFSDTDTLTYTNHTNSTSQHIIISISAGLVTFSSTNNWSGSELISFTASDGSLQNTSNSFIVTVLPVNDAPYYTTIPTQNMTKNTNKTITLSSYFGDVEGTSLTYNVSTAPSHMNYTVSGATVTLAPEPNWTGTTSITFSASDGNATTNSNSVSLVVSAGNATNITNRPPSLGCPLGRIGLATGESATYTITKSDPDGNTLTVEWKIDGTVIEGETGDSYEFSKDASGSYVLKAVVTDGTATAECTWTIGVTDSADANYTSETADVASIVSDMKGEIARCGDNNVQEGENCANCPADVICKEGETCNSGLCASKTSSSKVLIIIGIIIVVILGGGFAAYKFTTKKDATTRIRDGRNLSNVEREMPSVDLHDIYTKESPKADTGSIPPPQENPLKGYVNAMREKGVSDSDIEQALKEKGWNIALIKQALKH
ncbi:MAG: Ig-like domain-containing protein [Candidatus Nanoarchaeia archaeon]